MKSLFIRAEDKNIWERRSPITPQDLKEVLTKIDGTAFVQSSGKRYFSLDEYTAAGAFPADDLKAGDVNFGVKEIPVEKLTDGKVYLYFSHTIKGQQENMLMLKQIMRGGSTLIDYEKITDETGRRLVYFGPFAGDAGAIDILWLMGEYWKNHGLRTPFAACKQALHYDSVNHAKTQIAQIAEAISEEGLPPEISPLVIGVLGYGNVSRGAQNIFDTLPVKRIDPRDLTAFVNNNEGDANHIYISVFKEEHIVKNKAEQPFNLQEYYDFPEKYESDFEQYLPFLTILINATYWDKRYPKFVTWDALQRLYQNNQKAKLQGIADIACDVNGSIECNLKTTDSGNPAYLVDVNNKSITDGYKGDGIVLLAVDNLPAELPKDASEFFSGQLKQFIPGIIGADFSQIMDNSGLPPEIKRAVIVYNGKLTPDFEYLNKYL